MKIETTPQPVKTVTDTSAVASTTNSLSKVMGGPSVSQAASVGKISEPTTSGIPDLPAPGATNSASTPITDDQIQNIGDLLRWIATLASELIKMQNELNVVKQVAVEKGFGVSIQAANENFSKNLTQAIVGIVGSAISGLGAGYSMKSLTDAGKIGASLEGMDKASAEFDMGLKNMDKATGKATVRSQASNIASGATQSIGGVASSGAELASKEDDALSQLISKTAENIASTGSANQAALDKFVNDMLQSLKNLYASASR